VSEDKKEGWIKLHRKICQNPLFKEVRKFSKFEAWIDILLSANHKDNEIFAGFEKIIVRRGEFITSEVKLSKKWGWHRSTVRKFLAVLIFEKMLLQKCTTKYTALTVVNYEEYQSECTAKRTTKEQQSDSVVYTNKNVKNDKNIKNKDIPPIIPLEKISFAEYVTMTNAEYEKLLATHGKEMSAKMIEILDNYKGSNGKKYTSDYRAILSWVVKRVKEEEKEVKNFTNKPPTPPSKSKRISHIGGRDIEKMYGLE